MYKRLYENARHLVAATDGSGAVDLVATNRNVQSDFVEYGTGIAVQIPLGYMGILSARSSISNTCLILCNGVGYIDSDYRGEVKLRFRHLDNDLPMYIEGERIGQLTIVPIATPFWTEVTELSDTARGSGGFGSTGR